MSTAPLAGLAALRSCWHPVAYAADLADTPHATMLLGEPLVLGRDAVHSTQERYGIVWAALAPPAWPVPDVPELDDPRWRTVRTGPFAWACDASRQVENFTDFGHFAFVHAGLLGDPSHPVVAPYDVRADGHVLRYAYGRPDVPNTEDFPVFAAEERKDSPVAADRCVGYCLVARNYNLDQPDEVIQAFERTIFAQDQRVVESQRPERVPFDLAAELHLTFDAAAVAYRRAMRAHGLS